MRADAVFNSDVTSRLELLLNYAFFALFGGNIDVAVGENFVFDVTDGNEISGSLYGNVNLK